MRVRVPNNGYPNFESWLLKTRQLNEPLCRLWIAADNNEKKSRETQLDYCSGGKPQYQIALVRDSIPGQDWLNESSQLGTYQDKTNGNREWAEIPGVCGAHQRDKVEKPSRKQGDTRDDEDSTDDQSSLVDSRSLATRPYRGLLAVFGHSTPWSSLTTGPSPL